MKFRLEHIESNERPNGSGHHTLVDVTTWVHWSDDSWFNVGTVTVEVGDSVDLEAQIVGIEIPQYGE